MKVLDKEEQNMKPDEGDSVNMGNCPLTQYLMSCQRPQDTALMPSGMTGGSLEDYKPC